MGDACSVVSDKARSAVGRSARDGELQRDAELDRLLDRLFLIAKPGELRQLGGALAPELYKPAPLPRPKSPAGYVTLSEAGALACSAPETVRYWIWQGRLTAYKPGRAVLVKRADVLALIDGGETVALRAGKVKAARKAQRGRSPGAMRGQ